MPPREPESKTKGSPFAALKGLKKKLAARGSELEAKKKVVSQASSLSEAELFAQAMQGVRPLAGDRGNLPRAPRREAAANLDAKPTTADAEDLQELIDVLEGHSPLDFSASAEWVEGRAADCSRLQLTKLRAGDFAVQAYVDLHGMGRDEAKEAVGRFLEAALAKGQRCVLVICGRGLRSPGGVPVIKESLVGWLAHGKLSRLVLAFSSARPHDGGVGAIYVLLRRAGGRSG